MCFLQTIYSFTEITVGASPINDSVRICAFVEANGRDANWPEIMPSEDPRIIDYGADTGLAWVYEGSDQKFHLLCKDLPEGPTMAPTKAPTRAPSSSSKLVQEVSIELPPIATSQLVHGLCVTNAKSASARSTYGPLTYSGTPFNEGVRSWNDRSYTTVNIKGGPCENGTFLRPSRHKSVLRGTVITIDLERRGDDEMTLCVFTSDWRDGGFPTSLKTLGFTRRDSKQLAWLFRGSEQKFTLRCKEV